MNPYHHIEPNDRVMPAAEFKARVANDPAWATTVTERTHVIGTVILQGSPITDLSPLLVFHASDEKEKRGWAADFLDCHNLTVGQGTFIGDVRFGSALRIIKNFTRLHAPFELSATKLQKCVNLEACPEELLHDHFTGFAPGVKERLLKEIEARKALKQPNIEL